MLSRWVSWCLSLQPDFNTVALLSQNVVGREQSNLTSTLYTATIEGREQSNLTSTLSQVVDERKQCDLTSTPCHTIPGLLRKGVERDD